jgi:hypothetical protein
VRLPKTRTGPNAEPGQWGPNQGNGVEYKQSIIGGSRATGPPPGGVVRRQRAPAAPAVGPHKSKRPASPCVTVSPCRPRLHPSEKCQLFRLDPFVSKVEDRSFTATTDVTTDVSLCSVFVSVLLTPSADGPFALQWANHDGGDATGPTLKKGSWMRISAVS